MNASREGVNPSSEADEGLQRAEHPSHEAGHPSPALSPGSRKIVPRATLCVHTVTTHYLLWLPARRRSLFHRFRILPLFRPFFFSSARLMTSEFALKKLMKMLSRSLLISCTKSQRKTCGKGADFLRKLHVVACAKACGKPVENWWISSGTTMEKPMPDPAGRLLLSYCKVDSYATCSVLCAGPPQDVGGAA